VIGLMTEWVKGNQVETRVADGDMGGTMRLGAYPAALVPGWKIAGDHGDPRSSLVHRRAIPSRTEIAPV